MGDISVAAAAAVAIPAIYLPYSVRHMYIQRQKDGDLATERARRFIRDGGTLLVHVQSQNKIRKSRVECGIFGRLTPNFERTEGKGRRREAQESVPKSPRNERWNVTKQATFIWHF